MAQPVFKILVGPTGGPNGDLGALPFCRPLGALCGLFGVFWAPKVAAELFAVCERHVPAFVVAAVAPGECRRLSLAAQENRNPWQICWQPSLST